MTRHLGTDVRAYVDRTMDPRLQRDYDRHLVACEVCRHAADSERRLVTSLRDGATPGVPNDLHAMLMRLAFLPAEPSRAVAPSPPRPGSTTSLEPVPAIPAPPSPLRPLRLPTVAPAAPALHRSPRRAAALAGLAAGASAAAAIGLSFAGPAQTAATVRQPVVPLSTVSSGSATAISASFGSGLPAQPLRSTGRTGR